MLTESIEVQIFRFLIQTQTADNEKGAKPEHRGMWSFRDCSSEGGATECSNNQGMFKLSGSSVLGTSYIWILTVKEFRRDRKLG